MLSKKHFILTLTMMAATVIAMAQDKIVNPDISYAFKV